MRSLLAAAASLVAALPLSAQADHFTTSPEGFDNSEGNGVSNDLLGTEPLLRYQQIDGTNLRSMTNRVKMAFRRDGWTPDNPAYGPRTIELEVVMSESNLANISTVFANNYTTNTATVVNRKFVNFEDWSLRPVLPPAIESNIIPFDVTWNYAGKTAGSGDLLWEVKVYSNTSAGVNYPFDFDLADPNASFGTKIPTRSVATNLGTGCISTGRTSPYTASVTILNDKTNFTWQASTSNAVPLAPAVMFIDVADLNLSLPGLCEPIHALLASYLQGTASATGSTSFTTTFPHNSWMIGQSVVIQAMSPDAPKTLGVSMSRGQTVTIPADPNEPVLGRVWALNPNASIATVGPFPGGIIIYTNHP